MKNKKLLQAVDFFKRLTKSWSSKLGFALLFFIVFSCLFIPLFLPFDEDTLFVEAALTGPSPEHIFGVDVQGRDLFVRILVGGRYSLLLGLTAAIVGAIIGSAIGLIAGYFGGITETIIMRIMDIWSSLPGMLLCILISSAFGSGFFVTVIALTIGGIPGSVRMIRGQVLSERGKEYIEAAESINCSKISIMFKHLLPNVIQPVIVTTTMSIGGTIGMAASLSYIGLGIQPPTPEWGALLNAGKSRVLTQPYLILFPGISIALTILAINLVGDGLRDALDPKLRR